MPRGSKWWKKLKIKKSGNDIESPRTESIIHSEQSDIMFNRKVFIRIIEVLLCIACVVALRVTDDESRRVFHYLRNYSREWSLLNNVTWGSIGAALATVTCGGYVIITAGLLFAAAAGELHGKITELFLLGLGVVLFVIVGALSLASIESVPPDLVDNAAVLGALCLVTALVFIADLLMTSPEQRKINKQDGVQTFKEPVKPMAMLTTEKETKASKKSESASDANEPSGHVNEAFDKRLRGDQDVTDNVKRTTTSDIGVSAESLDFHDRDIRFIDAERQSRDYRSGWENTRDGDRYRDSGGLRYRDERDDDRVPYKRQEIIMRPSDEIDTPRFPVTREGKEAMFPKIVNPSVKIMRVERDVEDGFDNNHGRYSDSSQYDNVPTRIAPGILKHVRDRSYNIGGRRPTTEIHKDEIEALEEWVGVLRKSTTGTQTKNSPSSPTDPGYVRHTAENWPREIKLKTPGTITERETQR